MQETANRSIVSVGHHVPIGLLDQLVRRHQRIAIDLVGYGGGGGVQNCYERRLVVLEDSDPIAKKQNKI